MTMKRKISIVLGVATLTTALAAFTLSAVFLDPPQKTASVVIKTPAERAAERLAQQRASGFRDEFAGLLGPDVIRELAASWDATKLRPALRATGCTACADEALRTAVRELSTLGAFKEISKASMGKVSFSKQLSFATMTLLTPYEQTVAYDVVFESGRAKITIAMRGDGRTSDVVMMHIRPQAPAAAKAVTLGRIEPWMWEYATTW
jgi:hypothetical protein